MAEDTLSQSGSSSEAANRNENVDAQGGCGLTFTAFIFRATNKLLLRFMV